ncbi:MAG: 5-(carboxyamino)imidazole ribonucleotide synthase [Gammaproteobacteria bacterium]|nr:5-(carboxyamino)imidazole ribonucleotide synthase [Gammaproteobacteria bacterium]
MARVGIIGAGQLGQMLGYAGRQLGLECTFLDPAESPPAASAGRVIADRFDGPRGLAALQRQSDVISYEFENVPVETVESFAQALPVYPPAAALRHAQDRVREKQLFETLGIPVPAYRPVDSVTQLNAAIAELGTPLVLKTRRLGYDGKGQAVIRGGENHQEVVDNLGGASLIAEEWVNFDLEVSAIAARSISGELAFYPLTENRHTGGILRTSRAPFEGQALTRLATDYMTRLLQDLEYVGVLALELFVCGDRLLANEFAPRVHNSGHWTIEGCRTSQFENHLRAILDLPLGSTELVAHAGMVNIIGHMPETATLREMERIYLHDYGKTPRPGRKLGHVTVLDSDAESRDRRLLELTALLEN